LNHFLLSIEKIFAYKIREQRMQIKNKKQKKQKIKNKK
jgi:hypothetical protein